MAYKPPTKYMQQKPTQKDHVDKRKSERVKHLTDIFKPRRKVWSLLDIGCGNAEITNQIADTLRIKYPYGADVYDEKQFKPPHEKSRVKYIQVKTDEGSKIDLPNNSVDLITCFMAIHHFQDFQAMMDEICRVLKPKGWLFIREHDVPEHHLALKETLDQLHLKFPDHPPGPINYWPRTKLKQKLTDEFQLKHLADSDYPSKINNKQAIYHSLFFKNSTFSTF